MQTYEITKVCAFRVIERMTEQGGGFYEQDVQWQARRNQPHVQLQGRQGGETMKMRMSEVATLRGRPIKNRFKPQPGHKSCLDCQDNHTMEAQIRGIVCTHLCHKFQGY